MQNFDSHFLPHQDDAIEILMWLSFVYVLTLAINGSD